MCAATNTPPIIAGKEPPVLRRSVPTPPYNPRHSTGSAHKDIAEHQPWTLGGAEFVRAHTPRRRRDIVWGIGAAVLLSLLVMFVGVALFSVITGIPAPGMARPQFVVPMPAPRADVIWVR